jgi:aspartyl-tRNA(Asn)/glutamyl-tRNA(Gln) amidotransferase subunit C
VLSARETADRTRRWAAPAHVGRGRERSFCEDRVMAIDREQLLHVAHLARLELREDEIERLQGQLNDILAAVSKVSELDLSDVPPTSHPLDVVNVWEADEPRPCLTAEEALANAPEREGDFFKVPPGGAA